MTLFPSRTHRLGVTWTSERAYQEIDQVAMMEKLRLVALTRDRCHLFLQRGIACSLQVGLRQMELA
jgi:hypothetical protein